MTAPTSAPPYPDRASGGAELARLVAKRGFTKTMVVAVPPGGVEVGVVIARTLGATLEIVGATHVGMVQEIQHAVGGVAEDGSTVFDPNFEPGFSMMGMVETAAEMARSTVSDQTSVLRAGRPFREVAGKQVILVDDLIVIPWVLLAAAELLQHRGTSRIAFAAPVGAKAAVERLEIKGLEVICPTRVDGVPEFTDCYADADPPQPSRVKALMSTLAGAA